MKRYYIAYGSNLNVQQMRWRCPGARIIGTSELQDYRLLFKGSKTGSYLTVEPEKGCTVPVVVWEVTDQDELALDRYEGYPSFYYKTEMTLDVKGIRTGKLRRRRAFVYIMREERPYGVPANSYLSICGQGYRFFGFPVDKLLEACRYSRERMKHHEGRERYPPGNLPTLRQGLPRATGAFQRGQRNAHLPGLRYPAGAPVHRRGHCRAGADY